MSDQAMGKYRKPWPQPFEFLGNAIGVVILAALAAGELITGWLTPHCPHCGARETACRHGWRPNGGCCDE